MSGARRPAELFRHCPVCGAAGLTCTHGRRFACAACDQVYYGNTATGVAAIIVDDEDRLLAVIRGRDPGRGMLDLPGGFVEPGEGAEESLLREVREELGLTARDPRYLGSHPNVYDHSGIRYDVLDLIFSVQVDSFAGIVAGDDAAAFRFIPRAAVRTAEFAFPSIRHGLERWLAGD